MYAADGVLRIKGKDMVVISTYLYCGCRVDTPLDPEYAKAINTRSWAFHIRVRSQHDHRYD